MILVFYLPAYSEQNIFIDVDPNKSKDIVISIFALMTALFPSQVTLLYIMGKNLSISLFYNNTHSDACWIAPLRVHYPYQHHHHHTKNHTIIHHLLLSLLGTKSSCKNNMSIIIITCSVLYFLAFGLICYLYSLTKVGAEGVDATTTGTFNYFNQIQSYSCNCKKETTVIPKAVVAAPEYSFTCPYLYNR